MSTSKIEWIYLRVLKKEQAPPGFLIRVPLFERDWCAGLKRELGLEWRLDHTHETEYTLESFKTEMEQAGLEIRRFRSTLGRDLGGIELKS